LFLAFSLQCDFDRAAQQCVASGHCQVGDAGVLDAGSGPDAGTVDSGVPPDAGGGDSGSAVDAGTWCQVHAPRDICFDYDEADAGLHPQSGNQCAISGVPCTVTQAIQPDDDSPPNALVMSLPQLGAYPDDVIARQHYSWPTSLGTASIGFDVRSEGTYGVLLAAITWNTVVYTIDYGGYGATPGYPNGNLLVDEASYQADSGIPSHRYFATVDAGSLDITQWHRFVLTVSATAQTVTLTLDGVPVVTDTTQNVPLSGSLDFEWGISYANGPYSGPTHYHFDNVVLRGTTP